MTIRSRITEGDGDPRHGTANGYGNLKCRCRPCTDSWAEYMRRHGWAREYMRRRYRQAKEQEQV